jgi:hypothetical protein
MLTHGNFTAQLANRPFFTGGNGYLLIKWPASSTAALLPLNPSAMVHVLSRRGKVPQQISQARRHGC